ncbi:MAG: hypothetical protein COB60_05855 [Flavobacteriaceae bacterium]|nr:MAG: hypothetical protein COB60_05855 [Flavobacteriaceae bacterium]
MKKRIFKLLFLFFLGVVFTAQGQEKVIKGSVVDQEGIPLPGSTVSIKWSTKGVSTDFDGMFSINASSGDILVFSYLGYKTKEVTVSNQSILNVILIPDQNRLEEVVVVGYGSVKKKDLTGAVTAIDAKDFNKGSFANVENLIQGRAAGVQVSTVSSQPGAGLLIRIRGNNSINSSNAPLYVVDGFPLEDGLANNVNPNDIKSISILKDASATAIYGSRGANGVVIITTKRGTDGVATINVSSDVTLHLPAKDAFDFLNTKDWMDIRNRLAEDIGNSVPYTQEQIDRIEELGLGTDWIEEAFQTGTTQNHQLSIKAGNKSTKLFVSLGLLHVDGVVINTDFDRYTTRINLDQNLFDDKLKFGFNSTLTLTNTNFQGFNGNSLQDNIFRGIFRAKPLTPTLDVFNTLSLEDRELLFSDEKPRNPLQTLLIAQNISEKHYSSSNMFLEYEIADGLKFKTSAGASFSNSKTKRFLPSASDLVAASVEAGSAKINHSLGRSFIVENTLNYNKTIHKNTFNVLIGNTNEWNSWEGFSAGAKEFSSDLFGFYNLAAGSVFITPTSYEGSTSLASYIARANYTYDDRYLLTFTYRRDGSSRFGKGNKWGNFPAAAIAWKVHNENFIGDDSKISTLKLRASFGITGNQGVPVGATKTLFGAGAQVTTDGTSLAIGTTASRVGNSGLQWEETAQTDVGIELGLFDDKVFMELGAYQKYTSKLLLNKEVAPSLGIPWNQIFTNGGEMSNRGLELSIDTKNISTVDFSWNTNLNAAYNENKIKKLFLPKGATFMPGANAHFDGTISGYYTISQEGLPLSTIYGYRYVGILQVGETAPAHQPGLLPGQAKFKDIDGNGVFDSFDKEVLGNGYPKYTVGLTNSFNYKNFNLSLFFSGVFDVEKINGNTLVGYKYNTLLIVKERWHLDNQDGTMIAGEWIGDQWINDSNVESASYVRLKNVSFSYTFDSEKLKWLSSLQVYGTASNLLTWTSYSGFDPEVNSGEGNINVSAGLDVYSYPNQSTYSLGLKIGI